MYGINVNDVIAGRYRIEERIGTGGFSSVYRATDLKNNMTVAIKKYRSHDVNNKKYIMKEVEHELNMLKYTTHPNLPKVFDIVVVEDEFFMVMEFVEGVTLRQLTESYYQLRKNLVIGITRQLLSALYYLHSLEPSIVYRDLKPDNVIIRDDGRVKLIDFGSAKRFNRDVSADIMAVGTKGFAAPEQFGDKVGAGLYNTDTRTDIYGAGALIYYIATGIKWNTKGYYIRKTLYCIRYSAQFRHTVSKALELRPSKRHQSTLEMLINFGN